MVMGGLNFGPSGIGEIFEFTHIGHNLIVEGVDIVEDG